MLPGMETSRRVAIRLVSALVLIGGPALSADRKDVDDCRTSSNPDRRLESCTRVANDSGLPAEVRSLALQSRGLTRQDKGDVNGAKADFDEAIRIDPRAANAYMYRASLYRNASDHDHAIADLNEAIRINPTMALFFYRRGMSWYAKQNYDRAIA